MTFKLKFDPTNPSLKISFQLDLIDLAMNFVCPSVALKIGIAGGRVFKVLVSGKEVFLSLAEYALKAAAKGRMKEIWCQLVSTEKGKKDDKNYLNNSFEIIKIAAVSALMVGLTQLASNPDYYSQTATSLAVLSIAVCAAALRVIPRQEEEFKKSL